MTKGTEKTRRDILDASWRLLSAEGGHLTRMSDIAKEASVSRQAVYLHFANRAELLIATTHHIDEVEDVAGSFTEIDKKSGVDRLTAFIDAWCNYIPVIYGGARSMLAAKNSDADIAEAWQDRMDALLGACRSVVEELKAKNKLQEDLATEVAAEWLWSTLSVQQWELLTKDRGWSQQRYVLTMQAQLNQLLVQHK